jgi:hypothetical protein
MKLFQTFLAVMLIGGRCWLFPDDVTRSETTLQKRNGVHHGQDPCDHYHFCLFILLPCELNHNMS